MKGVMLVAIAHVVWKRVGLTEGRLSVAMAVCREALAVG